MHRILALSIAAVILTTAASVSLAEDSAEKSGKFRHVVLFKFKDDVTQEQIDEVVKAFAALPKKIDVIKGFEWGTDASVENKAAGFTHGFILTFDDAQGRDTYLPHPAHKEFGKLVGPRLAGVLVFDYGAK
ncbi:MAG: Dabb family protein [Pirellulaceae bacterium]